MAGRGSREMVHRPRPRPSPFPKFTHKDEDNNLRIVAPHLWIGAEHSPSKRPTGQPWELVVDLYGVPLEEGEDHRYDGAKEVLHWPFIDGEKFPDGLLQTVVSRVSQIRPLGHVLIQCQAGLSRSASATYAVLRLLDGLTHEEAFLRVYAGEPDFPRKTTIASARAFVDAVQRRRGSQKTK